MTEIKIEITGMQWEELIQIVNNFKEGKVEVESGKAYWVSRESPTNIPQVTHPTLTNPGGLKKAGASIDRMRDSLFNAFS